MLSLQQRLTQYLAELVGEASVATEEKSTRLPLFLRERFRLCAITLWGRRMLFAVEDKALDPEAPGQYERLAAALNSHLGEPVVLVIAHLPSYTRNRLVRLGVAFVVPGSQFFWPAILIDLRERFPARKAGKGRPLTPTAQALVLYQLQQESLEELPLKEIA